MIVLRRFREERQFRLRNGFPMPAKALVASDVEAELLQHTDRVRYKPEHQDPAFVTRIMTFDAYVDPSLPKGEIRFVEAT